MIPLAYTKAMAYPLFIGTWLGECPFTIEDDMGITPMATVTGSIHKRTIRIKRTFYEEES